MINVSELINDPDFAQRFTVHRKAGVWVAGRFETTDQIIKLSGVIRPLNTKELALLPEGDTIKGGITIYSLEPLFVTHSDGSYGKVSDEVEWRGELYKIIQTQNYLDWGYHKATADRKLGA